MNTIEMEIYASRFQKGNNENRATNLTPLPLSFFRFLIALPRKSPASSEKAVNEYYGAMRMGL